MTYTLRVLETLKYQGIPRLPSHWNCSVCSMWWPAVFDVAGVHRLLQLLTRWHLCPYGVYLALWCWNPARFCSHITFHDLVSVFTTLCILFYYFVKPLLCFFSMHNNVDTSFMWRLQSSIVLIWKISDNLKGKMFESLTSMRCSALCYPADFFLGSVKDHNEPNHWAVICWDRQEESLCMTTLFRHLKSTLMWVRPSGNDCIFN